MDELFNITFDFWSVLLLFGFFQGLFFITAILVGYKGNWPKFLLTLLILVVTFNLFNYLILHSNFYEQVPHLVHVATPLFLLLGPGYYFYIKSLLYKKLDFKGSHLWHLIPFVLAIGYLMPFYTLGASEKVSLLSTVVQRDKQPLTPNAYAFLFFQISHSFCYVLFSIKLLREAINGNQITGLDTKFRWLWKFSIAFLVFWSIDFLAVVWYIFQGGIDKEAYYITMLCYAIAINILVFFAIRNSKVFSQIFLDRTKPKYETSKANSADLAGHLNQVLAYMEEKKPYLDTEFSLSKLAEALNKPNYLISQVLNMELGKNFYEFINDYRFAEVKERLTDSTYGHMTISAIAFDAGFPNKNTFNKVFKKQTGMTPSEYIKAASKTH